MVELAEDDFETARWMMERPKPAPRAVGYAAQQCVEKYLKAILEESGRPVPRTHDLAALLSLAADLAPVLTPHATAIAAISPFAVVLRYSHEPSLVPDLGDAAEQAVETMGAIRSIVRAALRLPPESSAVVGER